MDHPLSTEIMGKLLSRRVLYVAVLLHDIAKGRGGDHSVLGAEVAEHLCPRLGFSAAETETVSWLVRHHLLMSATAFKRDLADYKTILDFVDVVQSPERLRLLLCLTVVDIRAVGPGVWNSWKRQLLGDLYEAAEEVLRLGHKQKGRSERVAAKQESLRNALGMSKAEFQKLSKRLPESYWIAEPEDILITMRSTSWHQAIRRCRSPRNIIRSVARHSSPSMPLTTPAFSTASRARSTLRAATSSMHASTPRAMASRSTTSWCRTRWAGLSTAPSS